MTKLSVHRNDDGLYFVAYGYIKMEHEQGNGPSPETLRVSPFYSSAEAAKVAYDEKRAEYAAAGNST